MEEDRLGGLLDETGRNAALGWALVAALCVLAAGHALDGAYRWSILTVAAVVIAVGPAVAFRDPLVMPPWELLVLVSIPVVDAMLFGETFFTSIAVYVAVAAVALVVAVVIHRFTPVRMNHSFAIALVVITTLAVAGAWNVTQWVSDAVFGTEYIVGDRSQDAANRAMMIDFLYAAVAGLFAGVVFDRYFRMRSFSPSDRTAAPDGPPAEAASDAPPADEPESESVPSLAERLNVPEPVVRRLSRAMQATLAGLVLYGLFAGNLRIIVNATIALAITFFPALLEHDHRFPIEPELVFWLTATVLLHALGSVGLYDVIGAWDSLTHTLSASIVAAAGYAVVRAIDLHTDEVHLPSKMMFAFILLFVLAFGVVWEIVEFAIDLSAQWLGYQAVLAQHGIDDTIIDLGFDLVGAVVVAVWGSLYLSDLSHRLAGWFDGRSSSEDR